MGPSTLTRDQADYAVEGTIIQYRINGCRPLGSLSYGPWLRIKAKEFGPPSYFEGHNFVELNKCCDANLSL